MLEIENQGKWRWLGDVSTSFAKEAASDVVARRVRFEGVVSGFAGTPGVRFACQYARCHRFLEQGQCRIHGRTLDGRILGSAVLHAKVLVDVRSIESLDQGGPNYRALEEGRAVAVLEQGAVEKLANTTLVTEQARCKGAMSFDVSREYLWHALMGQNIVGEAWLVPEFFHDDLTSVTMEAFALVVDVVHCEGDGNASKMRRLVSAVKAWHQSEDAVELGEAFLALPQHVRDAAIIRASTTSPTTKVVSKAW